MKGFLSTLVAFATLAGSGCAHKELNPGRCNSNNDCPSGQTCDLSPQANGTCVCASSECMDGSAGAGGGGGGGVGGASGSGGAAGTGGMPDGSAGTGGCQPTCAAPKGICANSICVECVTSADCATSTKPICDATTNTCVPCTSDDQCVAKLGADPGVCMSHQDGRCAAVAETIYVQNDTTTCSDSAATDPGFGTATKPLCSMQPVPTLLSASKDLVLVRGSVSGGTWTFSGQGAAQTSIVGQNSGFIAAGVAPGFAMSTGSIFMRDLKISSSGSDGIDAHGGTLAVQNVTISQLASGIGISATAGTLMTSKVTVDSCAGGGILLDGAAFDIENTTVTNDGPGQKGTTSWGGILVNTLPSGGQKVLNLVTIQANKQVGLACVGAVTGTGVFASQNSGGVEIQATCGVTACSPLAQTCGAQ